MMARILLAIVHTGKTIILALNKVRSRDINREQKYVELAPVYGQEGDMLVVARRIPYDYLVIAIGSKSMISIQKVWPITVFSRQL